MASFSRIRLDLLQLTCCPGNSGDWPDHGLTRLEGPEVDGGGRGPWLVTPGHHGDRHRHHLVTSGSGGHRHRLPGLDSDLESGESGVGSIEQYFLRCSLEGEIIFFQRNYFHFSIFFVTSGIK